MFLLINNEKETWRKIPRQEVTRMYMPVVRVYGFKIT